MQAIFQLLKKMTYSEEIVRSKSKNEAYKVRLFYGGTENHPNMTCTCKAGQFGNMCSHKRDVYDKLSGFQKQLVIHQNEIRNQHTRTDKSA